MTANSGNPGSGANLEGEPVGDDGFWQQRPPWFVAVAGAVLIAILALVIALVVRDGDDSDVLTATTTVAPTTIAPTSSSPTTVSPSIVSTTISSTTASTTTGPTTTGAPTTTAASTTSGPATSAPTTTVASETYASAVWPWSSSSTRYDDPVEAARGFAEDFVGFTEPIIGEFQAGDSRSGEVEVRPEADGPVTVVFVRQLGPDDSWWVLGAATENILLDEPEALADIDTPLTISGQSLAFEGTVVVELRGDDRPRPLVEGFVTGGGTALAPFAGSFDFANPGEGSGALLLFTESARDGSITEASVLRVAFAPA